MSSSPSPHARAKNWGRKHVPSTVGVGKETGSVARILTSGLGSMDEELGMTICTTSYPDRLKTLKLDSLQRRRDRYTIIYMFKIKCGLVPSEKQRLYVEAKVRQEKRTLLILLHGSQTVQLLTS